MVEEWVLWVTCISLFQKIKLLIWLGLNNIQLNKSWFGWNVCTTLSRNLAVDNKMLYFWHNIKIWCEIVVHTTVSQNFTHSMLHRRNRRRKRLVYHMYILFIYKISLEFKSFWGENRGQNCNIFLCISWKTFF